MPARYVAYALGRVDFLIRSTDPEGPQWHDDTAAWRAELIAYCRQTQFVGLRVLHDELDEASGRAHVTFEATLRHGETTTVLAERSLFLRKDGRWLYHSGESER